MGSPFDFSTMFMTYMSVTLQLSFSEFYFIHDSFQSVVLLLISVQPARYVFKQILPYKGQRNPNSNSGLWAHGCNDAESPFSKLRCWAGHFKSDQTLIQKVPEQIPIYLRHFRKLHSPLIAKSWKLAWNLVIWEQTERGLGQKHKCYHAHPLIAVLHRSQNDHVSNADLLGHNTTLKRRNVGSPMMRHASGEKKIEGSEIQRLSLLFHGEKRDIEHHVQWKGLHKFFLKQCIALVTLTERYLATWIQIITSITSRDAFQVLEATYWVLNVPREP